MDVRTLTLGVLTHDSMTGYEIKKRLEGRFQHFVSAGYGSIYPALAELAAQGLVTVREVEQEKRPDKKVYALTDAGRERLIAALVATEPRHRVRSEFLAILYFAHLLPPEKIARSLSQMTDQWHQLLEEEIEPAAQGVCAADGDPLTPGMRFVIGYARTVISAVVDYLEREGPTLMADLAGPHDSAQQPIVSQAAE